MHGSLLNVPSAVVRAAVSQASLLLREAVIIVPELRIARPFRMRYYEALELIERGLLTGVHLSDQGDT